MKIDDLEAFDAVVRCHSISLAANELGLTQPAITRRVQNFEEALGVELLDRQTKPPKATALGRRVHEQCRAVLREIAALRELVASDLPPSGGLRLGLTQGIGELVLLSVNHCLQDQWPELTPQITTGWGGQLTERVEHGELDVATIFMPHGHLLPKGVEGRVLSSTGLAVVAPRDVWSRRPHKLADFSEHEWVLNPDGCGFRAGLKRALAERGLPLRVRLDTYSRDLQLESVTKGVGLGLIPELLLAHSPWRNQLQVLSIPDFKPQVNLWLLQRNDLGRLKLPVEALGAHIQRVIDALPSKSSARAGQVQVRKT